MAEHGIFVVGVAEDFEERGHGFLAREFSDGDGGEGTRARLHDLLRDLGIVTRDDWDELDLRLSQLEHRVRLLEDRAP